MSEKIQEKQPAILSITTVAAICHAANKQLCEEQGDMSQKDWSEAESWQQTSAVNGVIFAIANPEAPASAQHDSWLAEKEADGWKYGPVKNAETKEHPCCVPYDALPADQKAKDYLFKSIVNGLRPFIALPDGKGIDEDRREEEPVGQDVAATASV